MERDLDRFDGVAEKEEPRKVRGKEGARDASAQESDAGARSQKHCYLPPA